MYTFQKLNKKETLLNLPAMVELYYNAFTQGEFTQYLTKKSIENYLKNLPETSDFYLALIENKPVAMLISFIILDEKISEKAKLKKEKTIYIAEVMTHNQHRGKGLAETLLKKTINYYKDCYEGIIIRVWNKNIPAINLYKKLGFEEFGDIETHIKIKSGNLGKFIMNKVYLKKDL